MRKGGRRSKRKAKNETIDNIGARLSVRTDAIFGDMAGYIITVVHLNLMPNPIPLFNMQEMASRDTSRLLVQPQSLRCEAPLLLPNPSNLLSTLDIPGARHAKSVMCSGLSSTGGSWFT
jgi:hypothetical protein